MAKLVLVRHGQSEWNALDKWQGITDIGLTKQGEREAGEMAKLINDIKINYIFTSPLSRATRTQEIIASELGLQNVPVVKAKSLDERDYGRLTAMKRTDVQQQYGNEQYLKWRRGWDDTPPGGESLHDVYERVVPYYKSNILPKLMQGKNVLITAHGNSLRALLKYLDKVSDASISKLEMPFNEVMVYDIDSRGEPISKVVRGAPV